MKRTLLRILAHSVLTAIALGLIGWVFAEGAGMWLAGQATVRTEMEDPSVDSPPDDSEVTDMFRNRIPYTMAGWGFVVVVVLELIACAWAGSTPPIDKAPKQTQAETDQILNELLLRAEAERAAAVAPPNDRG